MMVTRLGIITKFKSYLLDFKGDSDRVQLISNIIPGIILAALPLPPSTYPPLYQSSTESCCEMSAEVSPFHSEPEEGLPGIARLAEGLPDIDGSWMLCLYGSEILLE